MTTLVLIAAGAAAGLLLILLLVLTVHLTRVSTRLAALEQTQSFSARSLVETGTVTRGLSETAAVIRAELSRAKQELGEMQAFARARFQTEQQSAASIRRLEQIIAGSHSKGAAGEHILEVAFARLPPEWQVRDLRVGNKPVEFALRLPNGLLLPIDSKWPASALLERLAATEEPDERARLRAQVEAAVLAKAREVRKYLDPSLTTSMAIAAVPDAVYELCAAAAAEAAPLGVAVVSYSLLLPYLLLVFQTTLRTAHQIDLQQLDAYLREAAGSLGAAQEELEGRFARAVTMLANSRDDLGTHLARARTSLVSLQLSAPERERGLRRCSPAEALTRP